MSDPQDYTVGWICAIPTEFAAARALLDEQHLEPKAIAQNDNNTYALGKMGTHNVVIAVMPKKEYGIVAAATVARDMVHSFPNVRVGLMVGVGGGAPSREHDIRLGDVVVGSRDAGTGGVLQYDYGKAMQNRGFVETGSLNQPPPSLLNAVAGLDTDYMMEGAGLDIKVDKALDRWKRLRKTHSRPPPSMDQLYRSGFVHSDSSAACFQECNLDISNIVSRQQRGEDEDNPAVHYGLIASANQVMKDAEIRDRLSKERGVLCFEMEAAGLMNHFPCLVVRGICDYSDSHKNKHWQGFAAMTAAAYAKDLLHRISPKNIEAEKRIKEVLDSMEGSLARIRASVDTMNFDGHIQKIKTWLSPPDASTNYNHARECRHEGTGAWFLDSTAFTEWKLGSRQHLWLHGMPGCGKTVLSTTILDHVAQMEDRAMLYFFFDFSDIAKQNPNDMCRALVFQLYSKRIGCRKEIDSLIASHEDGRKQPTIQALSQCLQAMMKASGRLCILLDALDECPQRPELLRWMQRFIFSSNLSNIQLIVTGRPEAEFLRDFGSWMGKKNCITLEKGFVNEDIQSYISTRLTRKEFSKWTSTPSVLEQIRKEVGGKADGLFRWVACQLDTLETCLDREELEATLKSLPRDLNETYSRILLDVPKNRIKKTIRLLQFLVCSNRPLTLQEAADVIAVRLDNEPLFDPKDRLPDPSDITRFCPGLVVVTETAGSSKKSQVLQLAHFTVKEYLLHHGGEGFCGVDPAISIKKTCLVYLSSVGEYRLLRIVNQFPLAEYAAEIWMDCGRAAESSPHIVAAIMRFLRNERGFRGWARFFDHEYDWHENRGLKVLNLYYTCLKGLARTVQVLLSNERGASINTQGGVLGNALHAASYNAHKETVQILLDNGADIHAQSGRYGHALQAASYSGHKNIVQILLNNGADIHAQGGRYGNALQAALNQGHNQITFMLFTATYIGHTLRSGRTVLSYAAEKGHESIVEHLIKDAHSDPTSVDNIGRTPLYYASHSGHNVIVNILLTYSSETLNWKDHYGSTPLSAAARYGNVEVVRSLLATDTIDVNSHDQFGRTPLWWARRRGYIRTSQILIDAAKQRGISLDDRQMAVEVSAGCHSKSPRDCDICILNISATSNYRHCAVCNGGDFDICLDCYHVGGHCLDKSHDLTLCYKATI